MLRVGESVGGCEPDEDQTLFLKACLEPRVVAIDAWTQWKQKNSLDIVDEALFRQMPLLYWNLKEAGYDGSEMNVLKGVARRTWYSNQLIFRCLGEVFTDLVADNIPIMILKGAAWGKLYYPTPYTRHMNDGDFMVPVNRLDDAIAIFLRTGWRPVFPFSEDYATTQHAAAFINEDGQEIDLHWHLLFERCALNDDDGYWQRAGRFHFQGFDAWTLTATDHLFHILMHGYRWNPLHPMRWVPDSCMLLKAPTTQIDWWLLMQMAKRSGLTLRLRQSLRYLTKYFDVPIPSWVALYLALIPIKARERQDHILWTQAGTLK